MPLNILRRHILIIGQDVKGGRGVGHAWIPCRLIRIAKQIRVSMVAIREGVHLPVKGQLLDIISMFPRDVVGVVRLNSGIASHQPHAGGLLRLSGLVKIQPELPAADHIAVLKNHTVLFGQSFGFLFCQRPGFFQVLDPKLAQTNRRQQDSDAQQDLAPPFHGLLLTNIMPA